MRKVCLVLLVLVGGAAFASPEHGFWIYQEYHLSRPQFSKSGLSVNEFYYQNELDDKVFDAQWDYVRGLDLGTSVGVMSRLCMPGYFWFDVGGADLPYAYIDVYDFGSDDTVKVVLYFVTTMENAIDAINRFGAEEYSGWKSLK